MKPHNDLTGLRYDKLKVIGLSIERVHGRVSWICQCDCGGDPVIRSDKQLKVLKSNDCGCVANGDRKVCPICKENKHKTEYHKRSDRDSGIQPKCIECTAKYKKERYWSNRDEEIKKYTASRIKPENVAQRKQYYEINKEDYRKRYKTYMADQDKKNQKLKTAEKYRNENAEKLKIKARKASQTEESKLKRRELHLKKKKSDIIYNLKRRLRARVRHIVRSIKTGTFKKPSPIPLLGCSVAFLKSHLESKFTDGMCWERLGDIHIDHIKPCARFNLLDPEEQRKCFHYSNLQPLWKEDNLKKRDKYDGD